MKTVVSSAFSYAIKTVQIGLLRLTLSSPKYANSIGKWCVGVVALGVGLEDVTGSIHIYKTITLQHVIIATGTAGGVLTRFAVKNPEHLQAMIDALNVKRVPSPIKG